jgi:hypothetical protein
VLDAVQRRLAILVEAFALVRKIQLNITHELILQ